MLKLSSGHTTMLLLVITSKSLKVKSNDESGQTLIQQGFLARCHIIAAEVRMVPQIPIVY